MNRIMVIVVVLSCTISNIIFAQSPRFMVGLTTNPTYFNNNRKYLSSVYEYYEGLNKHQFYLNNGVIIDYKLNSKFTISLKPTFFKRKFENDCVNFKQTTLGGIFYIANSDNCFYTIDASYSFLQIPLMLNVVIKKGNKWNLYAGLGNSINYGFRKYSILQEKNTTNVAQLIDDKSQYFLSWFSPTAESGIDFRVNKRLILNSNLNIQTEKPLLSNFSIGLGMGAKLGLF